MRCRSPIAQGFEDSAAKPFATDFSGSSEDLKKYR
jgi:hypothetical protein